MTPDAGSGGGVLHRSDGRIRLGWRILLWLGLLVPVTGLTAALLPSGLVGWGAALLLGGLVSGWLVLALDGRKPRALGLHAGPGVARETAQGLALGVAVSLGAVALMAAAGAVAWEREPAGVADWVVAGLAALGLFALPAAAEEVVFRGYPLQALSEAWGAGSALVATSVAFGLLHLANPGAGVLEGVNVTVAGLLLGALVLRTGSLWWASGAHLGWNWAHGFVADLPVSGLELVDAPGVLARVRGPTWLSGGEFGPEGSVATTAVALGAAAWVWWTPRLSPSRGLTGARPLMELRQLPGTGPDRAGSAQGGGDGSRAPGSSDDDGQRT